MQSEDCLYTCVVCVELDYNSCTSVCANSIMWNVSKLLEKELAPLQVGRYRGSRYSLEAIIQLQPDPATLTACVWPSGKELVWDELHPFRVQATPLWDPAKNKCGQGKGNVSLHSLHGRVEVSSYHQDRLKPWSGLSIRGASSGPLGLLAMLEHPDVVWCPSAAVPKGTTTPGESGVGCQHGGASSMLRRGLRTVVEQQFELMRACGLQECLRCPGRKPGEWMGGAMQGSQVTRKGSSKLEEFRLCEHDLVFPHQQWGLGALGLFPNRVAI